jgi:hypothetical protein
MILTDKTPGWKNGFNPRDSSPAVTLGQARQPGIF